MMTEFRVCEVGYNMMGVELLKEVSKGDVIYEFEGTTTPIQTTTSIQVSKTEHVEDSLVRYFNHACVPSSEFIAENGVFKMIATKYMAVGDEVTFDYRTTEEVIHRPFKCRCCKDLITGGKRYA